MGDWNKCIFHLTQDWSCLGRGPGEGHYLSWILINGGRGGGNVGNIQVTPGSLFTSGLGPLVRDGTGVLSNVVEYFYQIC